MNAPSVLSAFMCVNVMPLPRYYSPQQAPHAPTRIDTVGQSPRLDAHMDKSTAIPLRAESDESGREPRSSAAD